MTLPKQQKIKEQNIKSMKIAVEQAGIQAIHPDKICLLYTSPSPRDQRGSRMPSSA